MKENKTKPDIRFKGFTEAWEQRKLREIAEFNPKSELPEEFEYVDLESVSGTEMISHRTELKKSAPSRAQRLAKTGDVFYQMVRPYQKNNYLFEKDDDNYVFSTGYAQMRPYIDSCFLMSFLQTDKFVKVVLDNCTGTSYPAINSNDLSNLKIDVPNKRMEEVKIGEYFRSLDNLITLHQRECDQLKELKKSMLKKMFPRDGSNIPEVRFAGFTDAWEQRKFSDLYVKVNEKNDLIFGTDKIISVANMYYKEDVKESSDDYMKTYNVMRLGDIAFEGNKSKSYAHGRFVENTIGDGIVSHVFDVFRPIVSYDLNYWKYFINNENVMGRTMARCTKSSTMMTNLVANDFLKENVLVPAIEEQSKIGAYFANLDSLITLHQRELEILKNLKKTCLKRMFI